ncbi:MAG: phosphoribosylformylglycinamidine synthase [Candidatus Arcticimaribacter sp.]|nr:MAG: phosphoribosylformylglycinamidine synthase [Candidatus Arcticimaribacter sp.]
MIHFFGLVQEEIFAVETTQTLSAEAEEKLQWLFGDLPSIPTQNLSGGFYGPRATMITPWSTNAVEITQNMGIEGITRIEKYIPETKTDVVDYMLVQRFEALNESIFKIDASPETVKPIEDIADFNASEGLAMNSEEVAYLDNVAKELGRPLTDSEVFGFSQVNSEHCRHKIFNGTFVIDDEEKGQSLFQMIKETAKQNPNTIVSAYKDNVAFIEGPTVEQFAPAKGDVPSSYQTQSIDTVLSLKAETHNFPTTVEPFNGAATGSGGEIRDRLAGGKGSLPLAGTAVYMTPYSRVSENRDWENGFPKRDWLYQTPLEILIKASNGASDFGNKFGQPLITGSVLTFEHQEGDHKLGYDKVIMQAGGIGFGKKDQAQKSVPTKGDRIIILGGDNYRIGMGGAAVSSADTGAFGNAIELNAIQRSNPEMQKRVANAIRALVESAHNPIISIHDHGAGGHLNCLSELVEETGGAIDIDKLPLGDPTLSAKEIIGNESQERMGLILSEKDAHILEKIAQRERAPFYDVGVVTDDKHFSFHSEKTKETPIDLDLSALFGSSPKTLMQDQSQTANFKEIEYTTADLNTYIDQVLQIEAVACKDWLTNKVDRCVTGRVAQQQCVGALQLPLSNCGVMALDYTGTSGVATSLGHSPLTGLIDPKAGSINAIAESLTNLVWAPLANGLTSVSLSANWMWPCNNPGEDARLYQAVEACSEFAIALGINIPTGKDSLSMKQKYKDQEVKAPGTVIISAAGECADVTNIITPVLTPNGGDLYYLDLSQSEFHLGGSSFAQTRNAIGTQVPSVKDASYFAKAFNMLQELIQNKTISAGHDIGSGGLITSLLELCFPSLGIGLDLDLTTLGEEDIVRILFSEKIGILLQSKTDLTAHFGAANIDCKAIGTVRSNAQLTVKNFDFEAVLSIEELRKTWAKTSALLDAEQTEKTCASARYENTDKQPLHFKFPKDFTGKLNATPKTKIKAAVIREKGSNSEREMAYAMHIAGFDVRDVHMTDLIEGRETLEDINFIVAVGGFSNSDVLGSAKGWAGAFKYNEKAKNALDNFFARPDTLSLGVCNGCQLFVELGLITPDHLEKPKMIPNDSGKFECTFTSVTLQESSSILLKGLEGSTLGVWSAHMEGKFILPQAEENYQIPAKYAYNAYPANPNGSDYNTAMLCSDDGRHLVMMPHLERSTFPWNWGHYADDRNDEVSPWMMTFNNAYTWLKNK